MIENPYVVLGISENATEDEIKKAYRRKSKECHPDLHPDDPDASRKMNEVNEAYDILTHPEKLEAWKWQSQNPQYGPYGPQYGPQYGRQNGYYGPQYGNGTWYTTDSAEEFFRVFVEMQRRAQQAQQEQYRRQQAQQNQRHYYRTGSTGCLGFMLKFGLALLAIDIITKILIVGGVGGGMFF